MGTATEAGRALDIEIGRRLFGMQFCDQPSDSETPCSMYGDQEHFASDGGDDLPHYSTDIAVAWQVVDEMHARIYRHSCTPGAPPMPWPNCNYLELSCLGGGEDGWAAAFTCVYDLEDLPWHEHPDRFGGVIGATAPEAICLAALAALGVK